MFVIFTCHLAHRNALAADPQGTTSIQIPTEKNVLDEKLLDDPDALHKEVVTLYSEGKFTKAAELADEECRLREHKLEQSLEQVAACLNDLGEILRSAGRLETARQTLERTVKILEHIFPNSERLATALSNLALVHYAQGNYKAALETHSVALELRRRILGSSHLDVSRSLNGAASTQWKLGNYSDAGALYEQSLSIRRAQLPPTHPDIAESLNNLGSLHHSTGNYPQAEKEFRESLAILQKSLPPQHPRLAIAMTNLASTHTSNGNYREAESLHRLAVSIIESGLGEEHPYIAETSSKLAYCLSLQGRSREAALLYERAIAIQRKALGNQHPSTLSNIAHLAGTYAALERYSDADALYNIALSAQKSILGSMHPDIGKTLSGMGEMYKRQRDYRRALAFQRDALAVWEEALPPNHPYISNVLTGMAISLNLLNEFDEAEVFYIRALSIQQQTLPESHPDISSTLAGMGTMYSHQGKLDQAEKLYRRSLALLKKSHGDIHPNVAIIYLNLARIEMKRADYTEAIRLCKMAFGIQKAMLSSIHMDAAETLLVMATAYAALNRVDMAVAAFGEYDEIAERNLSQSLTIADDHRRLVYGSAWRFSNALDLAVSLHLDKKPEDRALADLALTTILRRKTRAEDLASQTYATLWRELPENERHILHDINAIRAAYSSTIYQQPQQEYDTGDHINRLIDLEREHDELWNKLGASSPLIKNLQQPVRISDIQATLPQDAALVEYIQYRRVLNGGSVETEPAQLRYAAYIILPYYIEWVDLGPSTAIESAIRAFRSDIQQRVDVIASGSTLYEIVLQPVIPRIRGARKLILAPDAELTSVPFGALVDEHSNFVVERFQLQYLTTARDLLRTRAAMLPDADARTVVVVANPSGTDLTGTLREADSLDALFEDVVILSRDAATETRLREQERPWILHLATHGFFDASRASMAMDDEGNSWDLLDHKYELLFSRNPMLYSGLVLADVGRPALGESMTDGLLTAYEVSGWDLRGTELVVLSACDTGTGGLHGNEGVLGLRRAFHLAGTETQVMSLWSVSDHVTSELMASYYQRLAAGAGRSEAMREVQLEMLKDIKTRHPQQWASFVVVGEGDPLSSVVGTEGPPTIAQPRGCQANIDGRIPHDDSLDLLMIVLLMGGCPRRTRRNSRSIVDC